MRTLLTLLLCVLFAALPGLGQGLILNPYAFGVPNARTFYWEFTTDTAEVDFANTVPLYRFGAAISTAEFYSSPSSLALDPTQTFSLVERYNNTDINYWTKLPEEGTVRFRFWYGGAWPVGTDVMLFQLTGKSIDNPSIDTDDALQVYFRNGVTNNIRMRYLWDNAGQNRIVTLNSSVGIPDSTWHLLECKWRLSQSPYMSISVNGGTPATTTTITGNTLCKSWHLLLIGNDLNSMKQVYIDNFEIYNYWMP